MLFRSERSASPSREIIEALSDDLNTPNAITVLRASYKRARDGNEMRLVEFMQDCEFLGLLRPKLLHVHSQGVMSRGMQGFALNNEEEVRRIRISIANNLPELRQRAIDALRAKGIDAEISKDGFVTLVPFTSATRIAAQDFNEKVKTLLLARDAARKAKNFKESDRIRDELAAIDRKSVV